MKPFTTQKYFLSMDYHVGDVVFLVSTYQPNFDATDIVPAIQALDAADFGPVCSVTKNLSTLSLEEDHIWVKSYSENSGLLEALVGLGLIAPTDETVQVGFTQLHKCKLAGELLDLWHTFVEAYKEEANLDANLEG